MRPKANDRYIARRYGPPAQQPDRHNDERSDGVRRDDAEQARPERKLLEWQMGGGAT